MKTIVLLVLIILATGCIGAPPEEQEVVEEEPVEEVEEVVVEEDNDTEPPVEDEKPDTHECLDLLTDEGAGAVTSAYNCFKEQEDYIECIYFLLKLAREEEVEENRVTPYAIRLYGKAGACARDAEELGVTVPEDLSRDIFGYYDCYEYDVACTFTMEEMDALIIEMYDYL